MYKFKLKSILLSTLLLTTCYILHATVPTASADFGLAVDPPILQIDATPPTSVMTSVTIQNTGSDPTNVSLQLKPFKSSLDNNGTVEFLNENEGIPGNDPLIFQKIEILDPDTNNIQTIKSMVLAPSQEKKLTIHIAIPKDEPSGDYYFSIIFTSHPELLNTSNVQQINPNTSNIVGSIGTNLLLSIGPKTKTTGEISDFSTPFYILHGPVAFNLLVANTSDHFITPKGQIVISNMFGQILGKLNLIPVNVLEKSERYMISDPNSQDSKIIWGEKALFGIYKARLRIALSDSGPLFDRTIYFFAFPIEAILGIVLASIIITLIGLRVRERLKTGRL